MSDVLVLDPLLARVALEVAVDQLTQPGKVDRPDGGGKAETFSLLATVEDSVESGIDGGRSARGSASRSPGRFAAIAFLVEVDATVGRRTTGRTRASRLRAWAAAMTTADAETLTWAVQVAEAWVARARKVTEPRRVLELRGVECPACGAETVLVEGGEGEPIVAPAMWADLRDGHLFCTVLGCEGRWPVEVWQGLAAHLDQQTAVEHLAAE